MTNLKHRLKDVSIIPFKFVNCSICVYEFYEQLSQFDLIHLNIMDVHTKYRFKCETVASNKNWLAQTEAKNHSYYRCCMWWVCVCVLVKYRLSSFFHEIFELIQNSMWYSSVFRRDNLSQKSATELTVSCASASVSISPNNYKQKMISYY